MDPNIQRTEKTKLIPLCPSCNLVPSIEITENNIKLNCKCTFTHAYPNEEYVKLIQSKAPPNECIRHKNNNKVVSFCLSCGEWMCAKCEDNHKKLKSHSSISPYLSPSCHHEHKKQEEVFCEKCDEYVCTESSNHNGKHILFDLNALSSFINIKDIKEKLINLDNQLQVHYAKLRDDYIKKINKAYEEGLKHNRAIIQLCNILINDFTANQVNNYLLVKNIIDNTHLSLRKHKEGEDIITYFLKNNLLPRKNINLDKFKIFPKLMLNDLNISEKFKEEPNVSSLLPLKDNRLASCFDDGRIKIYNPSQDYNCEISIKAHSKSVNYLSQIDDNKLISCSCDNTIKVWKLDLYNYQCLATLKGHSDNIPKAIALPNNRIASCSADKTIKIWDSVFPYKCVQTLTEHKDVLSSILLMSDNKCLVSCSNFPIVLQDEAPILTIWKVSEDKVTMDKVIDELGCNSQNSLIEIDNSRIALGGISNIWIVNIVNSKIEKTVSADNYICSLLLLKNGNIMAGDDDGMLYVYDLERKEVQKSKCHEKGLKCIVYLNENTIATGGYDRTIKILG